MHFCYTLYLFTPFFGINPPEILNLMTLAAGVNIGSASVISPVQYIKNESNTALAVKVKGTVTPTSGRPSSKAVVTKKDDMKNAKGKNVSIEFDIMNTANDSNPTKLDWSKAQALDLGDANVYNIVADTNVVLKKPTVKDNVTTPTYVAFRITGDAVASPVKTEGRKEVADPWLETDKVDVKVAFTFTPCKSEDSGEEGGSEGGDSETTATASIDASSTSIVYDNSVTLTAKLEGATIASVAWTSEQPTYAVLSAATGTTVSVKNQVPEDKIGSYKITAKITDTDGNEYTKDISLALN